MAGTITHEWQGTTLIITSDSGTSSMDLKGQQGDIGVRGPQGAAGTVISVDNTLSITGAVADAKAIGDALSAINQQIEVANAKINEAERKIVVLEEKTICAVQVESSYDTRTTADGANIVDGLPTEVKQIKGNTTECKNFFDVSKIETSSEITNNNDGTLTLLNYYACNTYATLSVLCPTLKANDEVYLNFKSNNPHSVHGLIASVGSVSWYAGTKVVVTQDMLDSWFYFYNGDTGNQGTISEIIISKENIPYQPYFTGLKNTKISGIKSTDRNLFDSRKLLVGSWNIGADGVYSGLVSDLHVNYRADLGGSLNVNTNDQVTVSFEGRNTSSTNKTFAIGFIYTDGGNSANPLIETTEFKKYSITSVEGRKVKGIAFSYYTDDTICLKNFCVKFGTDDTYEPYVEDTLELPETVELGKWDYIADNKLVKKTGITAFTGAEEWMEYNSTDTIARYWTNILDDSAKDYQEVVVNHGFKSTSQVYTMDNIYISGGGTKLVFEVDKVQFPTADSWKTYLARLKNSGNPLTIAYELITPTETDLVFDNEYKAYKNGLEEVVFTDVTPTIIQEYYFWVGGNEE